MDVHKVGMFIASKRKEKGYTQQELGERLFVTDKAVSKWERGLSLPDIAILEKLADELDTDIYSILQIEKKKEMNVEEILLEEKKKLKRQFRKKMILALCVIIFLTGVVLFKFVSLGYEVMPFHYIHNTNKLIHLGVPKYSFWQKYNEDSYSFKSFRGSKVLKSEMKAYLNTLEHISCGDTTYYYDSWADITIIDYSVQGNLFYSTINYQIKNGNYCDTLQVGEYKKELGTLGRPRMLYKDSSLNIYFTPSLKVVDGVNEWPATMHVYYREGSDIITLEESSGVFEIKNGELIYYRNKITEEHNVSVPSISRFAIKNKKLILKDNYLSDYEKSIILN